MRDMQTAHWIILALCASACFVSMIIHKLDEESMAAPRYFKHFGRVFEVKAFATAEAANVFMAANPGYGMLAEAGGEILLAPMGSRGVDLGEVPFAVRQALEMA